MLSLFSSFDYIWLSFPKFIEAFVFLIILNFYFKINFFSYFLIFIQKLVYSFFDSLNQKGYSFGCLGLFLTTMIFLAVLNFCSVFSFNFAYTSQVSLVLSFGLGFWLSFMIFFLLKNFKGFFSHSVPEGTPMILVPFLFTIELISNIIRPITLTVRLVANILAGHLLLILLSKVVFSNFFSFPFYFSLNLVEFFVALIQSYIFITMITLYYSEVQ